MEELGGRDLQRLRQSVDNARRIHMELHRNKAFHEGEKARAEEAIRGLDRDLNNPLYKEIDQRHREAIIKHESAAYATKDLQRYHHALDKALMKFHSLKLG